MKNPIPYSLQPQTLQLEMQPGEVQDCVMSEWRRLEAEFGEIGLSCSADWTEVWLNAYGDLVPHHFLTAREVASGRLVGICLVTEGVAQKEGPLPIRTLHIGTAGEPDRDSVCVEYNRLFVKPGLEREFAVLIVEYLESRTGFDQWNLDGFAGSDLDVFLAEPAGPEAAPHVTAARQGGAVSGNLELKRESAYWFDLKTTREAGGDVLSQLRSSTRRKVKRSLEAWESLKVDVSDSLELATEMFGELVELHQARWNSAGKPGSYSSDRFLRFHEELLSRLVPQQRMAFVRVRSPAGTLGCVQLLVDRNRALLYQCGRVFAEGSQSPGVVLDYLDPGVLSTRIRCLRFSGVCHAAQATSVECVPGHRVGTASTSSTQVCGP